MTHAPQLSRRRHIFVTPVAAVSLQRGRKRGGRGGGAAAPPLFEKGGIAPHFFLPEMTTSCLQQCLCILMFTGQMEISNCLPPPTFLVPATPLTLSMDDNCGEWVECMGVVSRRRVWLVGVGEIYGCGYWVWL